MVILKVLIIINFLVIFFQDVRERMVLWLLYPIAAVLAFLIQWKSNGIYITLVNTGFCFLLAAALLFISRMYCRMAWKRPFVNEAIGIGDILLFVALSLAFAPMAFMVLLVWSLFLAMLLHFFFGKYSIHRSVPLAGYMALFFAMVYGISFFIEPKFLFAY